MRFHEILKNKIQQKNTHLCLGIDPHLLNLPPFMEDYKEKKGIIPLTEKFVSSLIDLAQDKFPAVKFQSAFFESLGWEGFKLLEASIEKANASGLLTILDVKRGDISTTMQAYGSMAYDRFKASAMTVSPYMGYDVISPLTPWLKKDKGIYVVWTSSNPSGKELQNMTSKNNLSVSYELLKTFKEKAKKDGVSLEMGLVLGANQIDSLPDTSLLSAKEHPLLMPGLGPQGGEISSGLKNLVKDSFHLLPMSRGLTLLGDKARLDEVSNLENWDSYLQLVESTMQKSLNLI